MTDIARRRPWSYDPRCEELAEVFLEDRRTLADYDAQLRGLAQEIQDTIEAWLQSDHQ